MKPLTKEQAARLFTGCDKWTTVDASESGIPSLRTADGPNGLRIEKSNELGFSESHPAEAFPCACLSACSFDPELQKELGMHLGQVCVENDVQILLGPGVNHKRNPLCGRNFEYYSEDPCLTAELAGGYVAGLQSTGTAACLKHYAGNSREYGRLVEDSIIDERALHELYLSQFEQIIKNSHPWSIMCAYNKVNGTYCCENRELMDKAKSWGFDGVFISDWGAVSDPLNSFQAGLNLEMPGGELGSDRRLLKALEEGKIREEDLHNSAMRLKTLADRTRRIEKVTVSEAHSSFSRRLAEESAVLLKNEGELPLKPMDSVAVIGAFAKNPRIQGAGSSGVNAKGSDNLYEVLKRQNVLFSYARGYHRHTKLVDPILEEQAVLIASKAKHVVVLLGIPEGEDAEGYDRENLSLPENQLHLLDALTRISRNITVVLQTGGPVELPFRSHVKAILAMYFAGSRSGMALFHLLFGMANPCGHLAETWPEHLYDVPGLSSYHTNLFQMEYRESIFSGYRYYEKAGIKPAYAFGHGLSYTEFAYRSIVVRRSGRTVQVSVSVSNIGPVPGKETVQIYIGLPSSRIARPIKELKAFRKILLNPGETKEAVFELPERSFAYYDTAEKKWLVETGRYRIYAGRASDDIRLMADVMMTGTMNPHSAIPADYVNSARKDQDFTAEAFAPLLSQPLPPVRAPRPFTVNTTIQELEESFAGRQALRIIEHVLKRRSFPGVRDSMVFESPLRNMMWIGSSWDTVDAVVNFLNGKGSVGQIIKTILSK